jgi:hypothetical protein
MTIVGQNVRSFRIGLAATLLAAWAYSLANWMWHPNGVDNILFGLIGFVMLGSAMWMAPFSQRGVREGTLVLGTIVITVAAVLCALFVLLLRNL